jgi:hypothetical protein
LIFSNNKENIVSDHPKTEEERRAELFQLLEGKSTAELLLLLSNAVTHTSTGNWLSIAVGKAKETSEVEIDPEIEHYEEVKEQMQSKRRAFQYNPGYLTAIEYSFALAEYRCAISAIADSRELVEGTEIAKMVETSYGLCNLYWRELLEGPMLIKGKKS